MLRAIRPRAFVEIPASGSQLFKAVTPARTHMRDANCQEVDCPQFLKGWQTTVPMNSPQTYYIRREAGRNYGERANEDGTVTFSFSAGQQCFRRHLKKLDREAIYIERVGHNGKTVEANRFVDDFQEETYKLKRERE